MTAPHERYRRFLESLTPESLPGLAEQVTPDVRFKDPFNDVRGVEAMGAVFAHMFETFGQVRFTVHHALAEDEVCLMAWRFESRLRGKPWAFEGTSLLRFAADGRVAEHSDYWDAARDFYERFPVIGWPLAAARRALGRRSPNLPAQTPPANPSGRGSS